RGDRSRRPYLLGITYSTNGLVYALIGGVDTILGPLLGAAILRALTDQLSRAGTQSSLFIGIMLMLVVYLIPEGVLGLRHRFIKLREHTWPKRPRPSQRG